MHSKVAAALKTRTVIAFVVLGCAASLVWATASPAGSYQAPLQTTQVSKTVKVAAGEENVRGSARCPDGMIATGGGVRVGEDEPVAIEFDAPSRDGSGWDARGGSLDDEDTSPQAFTIVVICARGTQFQQPAGVARR